MQTLCWFWALNALSTQTNSRNRQHGNDGQFICHPHALRYQVVSRRWNLLSWKSFEHSDTTILISVRSRKTYCAWVIKRRTAYRFVDFYSFAHFATPLCSWCANVRWSDMIIIRKVCKVLSFPQGNFKAFCLCWAPASLHGMVVSVQISCPIAQCLRSGATLMCQNVNTLQILLNINDRLFWDSMKRTSLIKRQALWIGALCLVMPPSCQNTHLTRWCELIFGITAKLHSHHYLLL